MNQQNHAGFRARACRQRAARIATGIALMLLLALSAAPAAPAAGYVHVDSFGGTGSGLGQFNSPGGVAVDGHGALYVTDQYNDRVQKFTTGGVFVGAVGSFGAALGQFSAPIAALIDHTGKLLVGEYGGARVQVLSSGLTPLGMWGSAGAGVNQFKGINQIAEDSQGNIYVTEFANNRVQKFDATHAYVGMWSVAGATGIAIDDHDIAYVAGWNSGVISVFDASGALLRTFASPGTDPGQLAQPTNMDFAPDGSLLVGEYSGGRVSRFDPASGDFLGLVATKGDGPAQLKAVWGLATDTNGDLFVPDAVLNVVKKYAWDNTPPAVTHDYDGEWHSTPVTVDFSCTDDLSGVANVFVSTDGGATWPAVTSVVVPAPGTHSYDGFFRISYRAADLVGNETATKLFRVKIDTRAPISTVSGVPAGWTSGEVYAHIAAGDIGSGVSRIYYELDGAGTTELPDTGVVAITTPGQHTLRYWAKDNCPDAANTEVPQTVGVFIDMAPRWSPRPTMSASSAVTRRRSTTRSPTTSRRTARWSSSSGRSSRSSRRSPWASRTRRCRCRRTPTVQS